MLRKVHSRDGATITIYSAAVAIGGLASATDGRWYWALFGVADTGLDEDRPDVDFGGVEPDVESAFAALSLQWLRWVKAAGLRQNVDGGVN